MMTKLLLLFSIICVTILSCNALKLFSLKTFKRSLIGIIVSSNIYINSAAYATSALGNVSDLLAQLDKDNVNKVIFHGINPETATVYLKDDNQIEIVLPLDDPKSPSGPAQVIARVQHQPNVVCIQDIGDVLKTTSKKSVQGDQKKMFLSGQSPYPSKSDTPVKL